MDLQISGKLHQLSTVGLSGNYKNDITLFNKWLGLNGWPDVSLASMAAFFKDRMEFCKPSTVRRNKSAIKKAYRLELGNQVTLDQLAQFRAFFDTIQPDKVSTAVKGNKILTQKELKKLVAVSGPKTKLIIRALFETASRVSELCHIELKNCRINGASVIIEMKRQKTKTTDIVYITTDLFNEVCSAYKGTRYLFEHKGKPLSRFTVNTLIKNASQKINRPDVHAHTLRHSWATFSLEAGVPLTEVSSYLGHSRIDTTTRFYLHGTPSQEKISAVNALMFAV